MFELTDAVLCADGPVRTLVDLTLTAEHRRRHGRRIRVDAGRCRRPVTAIMDSQSVKAAETVSRDTRGFDGAKLINGSGT